MSQLHTPVKNAKVFSKDWGDTEPINENAPSGFVSHAGKHLVLRRILTNIFEIVHQNDTLAADVDEHSLELLMQKVMNENMNPHRTCINVVIVNVNVSPVNS